MHKLAEIELENEIQVPDPSQERMSDACKHNSLRGFPELRTPALSLPASTCTLRDLADTGLAIATEES
jgi:hypothetical protein